MRWRYATPWPAPGIEAGKTRPRYGTVGMGHSIYREAPEGNAIEFKE